MKRKKRKNKSKKEVIEKFIDTIKDGDFSVNKQERMKQEKTKG